MAWARGIQMTAYKIDSIKLLVTLLNIFLIFGIFPADLSAGIACDLSSRHDNKSSNSQSITSFAYKFDESTRSERRIINAIQNENGNNHKIRNKLASSQDDTSSITLTWTAPGDDDYSGCADHYDIRYSNEVITDSSWDSCWLAADPPVPLPAGTPQNYVLTGLARGEYYYSAIKTFDDAGNCSRLSNVTSFFAPGIMTPLLRSAVIDISNNSVVVSAYAIESNQPIYYEFELDTTLNFYSSVVDVDLLADSIADVTYGDLLQNQTYYWRCCAIAADHSDSSSWSAPDSFFLVQSDINNGSGPVPSTFQLSQSYPNPFNPVTNIEYGLPVATHVIIEIFDTMGRTVTCLINADQEAGDHNLIWNAGNCSSGTYFYRIHAGSFIATKKMNLLK
jgi:hypothetical protein